MQFRHKDLVDIGPNSVTGGIFVYMITKFLLTHVIFNKEDSVMIVTTHNLKVILPTTKIISLMPKYTFSLMLSK